MNFWLFCTLCAIGSYLLGSVNTSLIVSFALGKDIRNAGSGNPGTTNTLRTIGKRAAIIVLIGDVAKGIVSALVTGLLARAFLSEPLPFDPVIVAALFTIIGHDFPIYYKFKGGKGVATSIGVVMLLDWRIGLAALILALIVMFLTRYISLGSLVGAIFYIITILIVYPKRIEMIVFSIIIFGLLVYKHRMNISRLVKGEESKTSFKKEKTNE